MSTIQISIVRTATAGKNEIAKTYNTAIEGSMNDFKELQEGIDQVVDRIVWANEKNKKPMEEERTIGRVVPVTKSDVESPDKEA